MKNFIKSLLVVFLFSVGTAHAFFFIIPTGKISDLITGAEGDNCVTNTAKVGDKIILAGGKVGEIKSLSGTSTRCKVETLPIRALIEPVEIPTVQTTLVINLPEGYQDTPLTDSSRFNGLASSSTQKETESGIQRSSFPKHTVTDINDFAVKRKSFFLVNLIDGKESPVTSTKINGVPALQFEVSGAFKNGTDAKYFVTIFDAQDEVAMLTMWTRIASYDEKKAEFSNVLKTSSGLVPTANTLIIVEGSLEDRTRKCTQMGLQEKSKKFNDCLTMLAK